MRRRTSQILFDYWNEVRRDRLAPRRFDIEPARIASILAETFILERFDGANFRFRLAGTRICDIFGQELRNRSLLDLFPAEERASVGRHLSTITDQGGVGILEFFVSGADRRRILCECVVLPLTDPRGVVTRFVGAIGLTETPAWLGIEPLSIKAPVRCDVIWPDGKPRPVIERWPRQAPFQPRLMAARIVKSKHRQFRVFEGGRLRSDRVED